MAKPQSKPHAPAVVLSRVPPDQAAALERAFAAVVAALGRAGIACTTVDSVYDMQADEAGAAFLRNVPGTLVLLGWHPARALQCVLAQHGVDIARTSRAVHCLDVRVFAPDELAARVKAIAPGAAQDRPADPPSRANLAPRWYPVVDRGRCTNCMECLDFCLFGVYSPAPDKAVQVTKPAGCKTGCPACARVCPHAAIMFPKYAQSPINGDEVT